MDAKGNLEIWYFPAVFVNVGLWLFQYSGYGNNVNKLCEKLEDASSSKSCRIIGARDDI